MTVAGRLFERADTRTAARIHSWHDARRIARRRLPPVVFDYVDGAADDEVTMARNERAFRSVTFRPKMAVGPFEPVLSRSVLGWNLELPVVLAPCGLVRLFHADGAAGVARAAASRGTVSVLSTVSGSSLEEVHERAGVPVWFQLYASGGLEEARPLCRRAEDAGVEVLVVTVDTPALGNRERDVRHGVAPPLRVSAHNAIPLGVQVLARPRWAFELARTGLRLSRRGVGEVGHGGGLLSSVDSPFSWSDVAAIRREWPGKLVVKGVLSAQDARHSLDAGADAVVVSNHGGRQLDGAPATLDVLGEVAAQVGGRAGVLLDSGVRRGSHVAAALAMGATAVLLGRPYLYALAAAGERGVRQMLDVLRAELRRTMVLIGCTSLDELTSEFLRAPSAPGPES